MLMRACEAGSRREERRRVCTCAPRAGSHLDHRGQNSGVSRDETSGGMIGAMVVCGVAVCAVERHGARWQRARAAEFPTATERGLFLGKPYTPTRVGVYRARRTPRAAVRAGPVRCGLPLF
jgi:hypothetical protein